MSEMTRERGYAAARWTGCADGKIGVFEVDGNRMRSAETHPGVVVKWGHCNRKILLTPVLGSLAEVAAMIEAKLEEKV